MSTLKPNPGFNAWNDASVLRAAMKGMGTDESAIIKILTNRTLKERQEIQTKYREQLGRDLYADLKSELGGNFEKLILALMETIPDLLARQLNKAIAGIGTDDSELKGIICTMEPDETIAVKASYEKLFGIPLDTAVAGDVSGDYKDFLLTLLKTHRSKEVIPGAVESTAKLLYDAGEGRLGTDEARIFKILSENSFKQLKLIFEHYEKLSGKIFEQAVESEMSGEVKKAVLIVVKAATNLPRVYAEQLHGAMKGTGTEDSTLIRILLWRSEKDLEQVKREYAEIFGKSLEDAIRGESSGDYEEALVSIVQGN